MKKISKLISLILCLFLTISVCACGEEKTSYQSSTDKMENSDISAEKDDCSESQIENSTEKENSSHEETSSEEEGENTEMQYEITLTSLYNGKEISSVPGEIQKYLNLENEKSQLEYLVKNSDLSIHRDNIIFKWKCDKSGNFFVHFSESEDFKNEITTKTRSKFLYDSTKLIPGKKYYWKVTGENGITSKTDSFVFSNKPVRIITFDGCNNVRDIGGWQTADGKKVKFGKVIRGGRINNLTGKGIVVLRDNLGIQTELDLRGKYDDGGQNSCAFDENRNYLKMNLSQYCYILPSFSQSKPFMREYDSTSPEKIKKIFSSLADEKNYPFYVHCNAGADRTGTVIFLLNGMLGVRYEDLVRDFELTSFSDSGRRWRGDINEDFTLKSPVMQDNEGNYVAFAKMYNIMMNDYSNGGTIQDAITNYLIDVCNVTTEEINKIKSIMLE